MTNHQVLAFFNRREAWERGSRWKRPLVDSWNIGCLMIERKKQEPFYFNRPLLDSCSASKFFKMRFNAGIVETLIGQGYVDFCDLHTRYLSASLSANQNEKQCVFVATRLRVAYKRREATLRD